MLDQCKSEISDDEATVLAILNNENLDKARKSQYIECLHTELENIKSVNEKELWPAIFARPAVKYSAENILEYFFHSGKNFDAALATFTNTGLKPISFDYEQIDKQFGEGSGSAFLNAIVRCPTLDDKKYHSSLKSLRRIYQQFKIDGISDAKIKILIELAVIGMTKDNLLFMRAKYPSHLRKYIFSEPSKYANEAIDADTFSFDELAIVFESSVFKDSDIIKLLSYTKEPISVFDKHCSEAVKIHLLKNHFNRDDLPLLLKNYEKESELIQAEVERLCLEHLNSIVAKNIVCSFGLLTVLFTKDEIAGDNKVTLLANALGNFEPEQAKACFNQLGMNDYVELFERKRPKIARNAHSDKLLPILRDKGWVSYTEEKSDEASYYQTNGKKAAIC